MSEDVIYCISCEEEEKDPTKVIECVQCHKSEHFKCRKVFGNAIRKLRKKDYFCSLDCQQFYQRGVQNTSSESTVLNELQKVLSEVQGVRSEMHEMKVTIVEMERSQNFLSNQLDSLLGEVKSLKAEQDTMKSEAEHIRKKYHDMRDTVDHLELEVDRLNRASLAKNAILLGVPVKKDEDVQQIVGKVSSAVGYELPNGAILEAKRMFSSESKQRNPESVPIKVVFSNESYKEGLFMKKRSHGPLLLTTVDSAYTGDERKVMLRDEMTSFGMDLYKQVREIQGHLNYKFIWPGRNGVVLAKKAEHSKTEIIRSRADLQGLHRTGTKRNLDISGSRSQSSPGSEPAPKR